MIESDEKRIKQVLMNLQSNGLKFTKNKGTIRIIAQLVKGKSSLAISRGKSKLHKIYEDSFSSGTSSESDSIKSETSKFDKEHKIEMIFEPEDRNDKLVISVIDTGIGIKKKDKVKLFKLFGCLQNTRQMNT